MKSQEQTTGTWGAATMMIKREDGGEVAGRRLDSPGKQRNDLGLSAQSYRVTGIWFGKELISEKL